MMLQVSVSAFIAMGSVSAIRLVHCVECQIAVNSTSRAVRSTNYQYCSLDGSKAPRSVFPYSRYKAPVEAGESGSVPAAVFGCEGRNWYGMLDGD